MIKEIERILEEKFKYDQKRLNHIFGVRDVAVELAKQYGANVYQVEVASLLHDVMKNDSFETQKALINDQVLIDYYKDVPVCYHAIAGYYFAKDVMNITDPIILEAIFYHMWGKIGMTLETMIVCVADFCEPGRTFKEAKLVAQLAYKDIDKAYLEAIKSTIDHLNKVGIKPFSDQLRTYQYYNEKKGIVASTI